MLANTRFLINNTLRNLHNCFYINQVMLNKLIVESTYSTLIYIFACLIHVLILIIWSHWRELEIDRGKLGLFAKFCRRTLGGIIFIHCSVSKSCLIFATPWNADSLLCPSLSPRVHSNSCLLSQWWHPTISCSVTPFSSCSQSFPAPGSFPKSWPFTSGGQSIGASASTSESVNSMNT